MLFCSSSVTLLLFEVQEKVKNGSTGDSASGSGTNRKKDRNKNSGAINQDSKHVSGGGEEQTIAVPPGPSKNEASANRKSPIAQQMAILAPKASHSDGTSVWNNNGKTMPENAGNPPPFPPL